MQIEGLLRAPDTDLHVPALCDVEVAAAVRSALLRGLLSAQRMTEAIDDYLDLPLTRHGHQVLLTRILDLKENFSAYDATYVALAERLGARLITGDQRLARSARSHTKLVIVTG